VAQFARPSQDVSIGGWTSQAGSAVNLFASIDEDTANDADFVQCSLTVNDAYEVRLSTVQAALIDRGHILRYRGAKGTLGGNQRGVTVELRQGATVIASNSHPDLTPVAADGIIQLTKEQGAAITNYADLRVRFTATGNVSGPGGNRRRVQIYWCQLRVPEASFGAVATLVGPPTWQYTLNGVTGSGPSVEDALVDLFAQLSAESGNDSIEHRRWRYVYYARKIRDYTSYRAQIVADAIQPNPPMTKAEMLARVDEKMTRFDTITADADSQDGG
jgi:hypothetical protein